MTSALGTVDLGSASVVEAGDVTDLAWARWTDGTVSTNGTQSAIGANGGYHVMSGALVASLPASGKIDYELIGGTSATDNRGTTPGTVSGALSILFGSTHKVGYDMTMDLGGMSWAVSTDGGAADPSQSQINLTSSSAGWRFGGTFTSTSNTVTATGGACAGTCLVSIAGQMYGQNGKYAGVAMNVQDNSAANGTIGATGLAIFGAPGASGTGSAPGQTTMAIANVRAPVPATGIAPSTDWSRWSPQPGTPTVSVTFDPHIEAKRSESGVRSTQPLGDWITFGAAETR